MSLKFSDLTAAKNERFPDFVIDAEDEEGTTLELHFRPAYVLSEERRARLAEINTEHNKADSQTDEDIRALCVETMRLTARDPYHFEVLEKFVADNTDEGDVDIPMWLTIVTHYRKQTQMGEA